MINNNKKTKIDEKYRLISHVYIRVNQVPWKSEYNINT